MECDQFTFSVYETVRHSDIVRKEMLDRYHDDYAYYINDMFKYKSGIMVPLLLRHVPFFDSKGGVTFSFSDMSISVTETELNVFTFVFRDDMDSATFLSRYDAAIMCVGDYNYMESCVEERVQENGQSKILLSTLTTLCNSPQEVRILVIGSSTKESINSGRSYDVLIDYLGLAGYSGTLTMFDPHEREASYDTETFKVRMYARKYDYQCGGLKDCDGRDFTHVYDDVWVPTLTADPHEDVPYNAINVVLKQGKSKFAYSVRDGTLVLVNGLDKHKHHKGALGGGYMSVVGRTVIVGGTSTGVGPYREDYVAAALREYKVTFNPVNYARGRLTFDPGATIFKDYPKARISTKYFGEQFEIGASYEVHEQTWYRGLERRLVTNMCDMSSDYHVGCGCEHCAVYDVISLILRYIVTLCVRRSFWVC
jgi:hypothetical protein